MARDFNSGLIRAPIHLSGNNESQLIDIFKDFKKGDWCFSTWRNHYHALLAGVPAEEIKRQIMAGRSMTVCSPEHRFFSSAIFSGCCPIALGVAWQIKQSGGNERVFCFVGDMCAMSGLFQECRNYIRGWDLPIRLIVENNNKSVCTDTREVWGIKHNRKFGVERILYEYEYALPFPHSGAGKRIEF